jgi:hypothetical protein
MRIDSVGVRIPTRIFTNEDMLLMPAHNSPEASTLLVPARSCSVRQAMHWKRLPSARGYRSASDIACLSASKVHGLPTEKMFARVFPKYGSRVSAGMVDGAAQLVS